MFGYAEAKFLEKKAIYYQITKSLQKHLTIAETTEKKEDQVIINQVIIREIKSNKS